MRYAQVVAAGAADYALRRAQGAMYVVYLGNEKRNMNQELPHRRERSEAAGLAWSKTERSRVVLDKAGKEQRKAQVAYECDGYYIIYHIPQHIATIYHGTHQTQHPHHLPPAVQCPGRSGRSFWCSSRSMAAAVSVSSAAKFQTCGAVPTDSALRNRAGEGGAGGVGGLGSPLGGKSHS
jgi:hypothetical protein